MYWRGAGAPVRNIRGGSWDTPFTLSWPSYICGVLVVISRPTFSRCQLSSARQYFPLAGEVSRNGSMPTYVPFHPCYPRYFPSPFDHIREEIRRDRHYLFVISLLSYPADRLSDTPRPHPSHFEPAKNRLKMVYLTRGGKRGKCEGQP